jgi:HEAT repeat protein
MVELLYALRKAARSDEELAWVAAALAHSLGVLKDPAAENALIEAAEDPTSAPVQAAAIEALAETCPKRARRAFQRGLDAEDAAVVRASRLAIKKCGD